MKVAIITRPGNSSPFILAQSLKLQIESIGHTAEISFQIDVLSRLVSFKHSNDSFQFWLRKKLVNFLNDRKYMKWIARFDVVIISECSPNGFWKSLYNVEKFKAIIRKPVWFYEVYYLGNAPTQVQELKKNDDALLKRYDAHLYVSPVTEIRNNKDGNAFCIGILGRSWGLKPLPKKEFVALVDFAQPGYEHSRKLQIEALHEAGIPFISLEKRYSIDEIRQIYQRSAILFLQFPEAFGLPILECLCCGAKIFTPDSGWPMSWRLDEAPDVHAQGKLGGCFTVYNGKKDLVEKLMAFKATYDLVQTPLQVHQEFITNYRSFFEGNTSELKKCFGTIGY